MSLNQTPGGERLKIALFGRRNAGKSSLINAITGQDLAIVSDVLGTTTDPVEKNMELLPLGPVTFIDTPGLDDTGILGKKRVEKALEWLAKADIALVVLDGQVGMTDLEKKLLETLKENQIPHLLIWNKMDLVKEIKVKEGLSVSASKGFGIEEVKNALGKLLKVGEERDLLTDVVKAGDRVVLVIPLDKAAPKGRLILPQQQAIRSLLDKNAIAIVLPPDRLSSYLKDNHVDLVICDSQIFKEVSELVPMEIALTSFSILMARYKGELNLLVEGVLGLEALKDGSKVLISEGCTHHRQCEDIGTVKMPKWISAYTKKEVYYHFTSGGSFPKDLSEFDLIVHCGACMLGRREVLRRLYLSKENHIPITNYGVIIAYMNGILKRTLSPFRELDALRKELK